ncbi:MAG: hypothetical protein J6O40_07745 [Ruminococcus sp.]|nr:hypothetical protein [Ruminococcus sp.]
MASRVIHLAVAYELAARLDIKDKERFFFGHVLPDMIMGEYEYRLPAKKKTHFYTLLENGRKTYDFYRFYEDYRDKLSDMLYLGYYVHLIEDNIFRQYLYYRVGLLKRRGERELLDELYRDYHLLNPLLCERFRITLPTVPKGIEKEDIVRRFDFQINEWLDDMKGDLDERPEGELMHFTRELIDEFINECSDVIEKEINSLKENRHYLSINDYSIENYYKGELRK